MATKLLIVDDNRGDREAMVKAFSAHECQVVESDNNEGVFAVAQAEKPDLIILDLSQISKAKTLERFRTDLNFRSIPLMVVAAEAAREQVIRIAKMGVRDYVLKPINGPLLAERTERLIPIERKDKGVKETVRILVVEDKPLVIEQVKTVTEGTTWEILPASKESEVTTILAGQLPDIILISLSLPNEQGFNLFRYIHNNERTKKIPVFGLCVKTAIDEQTRAQQDGMTAIITKPIDINDLRQRLKRAMNVDTSDRFFGVKEQVLFVTFPQNADAILSEIGSNIKPQISSIVDQGLSKILLDLTQVSGMDTNVMRLLIEIIEYSDELGVSYGVVGSSQMAAKAKAFEETKNIQIYEDVDEALRAFA
jgi:two-component system, cell cycle response regulator